MASPKAGVAADPAAPGNLHLDNSRLGAAYGFAGIWLPAVLVGLLVIYLPGLGNALVFDDGYLADGELFSDYRSLFEFRARMLSYGSFVWVQALLGADWWKQRLFNILVHCGVVFALWALYRQILRHVESAAPEPGEPAPAPLYQSPALGIAIGFFALNPVAVYGVGYLIQRSILMATFFVVVGLWLFMVAVTGRKPWLHATALACYALAVMSKEHAILAPLAALPLYVLAARPRPMRLAAVAAAILATVGATAFLLSLGYGEILGKAFDEYSNVYLDQLARLDPQTKTNAFALSLMNQSYLFFHYGLRWFLPASEWLSINLRPPFPVSFATFPHLLGVAGYAGVLLGGAWALLRFRDWRALAATAVLLPALLFPTEFATIWVQDPFALYRSYLWAIGVPGLVFVALHGPSVRTLTIIALVLASLLTWQALDRVWSLSSAETAWTDAIRKLPNDPRSVGRWVPYLNRGAFYAEQNQFKLAMRDFETSAALGDVGMGRFNAGALLAAEGKHAQALASFSEAERQGYKLYNLWVQRGLSLAALGRQQEAFEQLDIARTMQPPSPTREVVLVQLGKLALQLGNPGRAISDLASIASDHRQAEARFLLAMAYVMQKDYVGALTVSDRMVHQDASSRAYYARALAHYGLKHKAEALADIENALRIGGDSSNLRQWREKIQAMR